MVKPGGTGRPAWVISATPAPLPPSRSRICALPSSKRKTHLCCPRGTRSRAVGLGVGRCPSERPARPVTTAPRSADAVRVVGFFAAVVFDVDFLGFALAAAVAFDVDVFGLVVRLLTAIGCSANE